MGMTPRALALPALLLTSVGALLPACRAEAQATGIDTPRISIGVNVLATESHSPPGSCGCFWLKGGAADAGVRLWSHLSGVVELAGEHASSVPGTTRGLSRITLLAGPRWTIPFSHRQAIEAGLLAGAARGFDAQFIRGKSPADTATGFAFEAGAAYNLQLGAVTLRLPSVQFVQSDLPNGSDGRQRDLRIAAGIVFHPTLPGAIR